MVMVKRFKLFWKDGSTNIVQGDDVAQAMTLGGFGQGSVPALDYQKELPVHLEGAVRCSYCGWTGLGDSLHGKDVDGVDDALLACPDCGGTDDLEATEGCPYCGQPACLDGYEWACDLMRDAQVDTAKGERGLIG